MKRFLSIVLVSATLFPTVGRLWILADFVWNQASIAKTLCINKEKPKSTCKGNCYLARQLKKAEEPADKPLPKSLTEKYEVFYWVHQSSHNLRQLRPCLEEKTAFAPYSSFYKSSYSGAIFRPPKSA